MLGSIRTVRVLDFTVFLLKPHFPFFIGARLLFLETDGRHRRNGFKLEGRSCDSCRTFDVFIYIYFYMHIYIYMHICNIYIYMHTCICTYVSLHTYI